MKYPLQSTKFQHFTIWCEAMDQYTKYNYSLIDLERIVALKCLFPKGLNNKLQLLFPNVITLTKQEFIPSTQPLNGNWIAGFVSADGHFSQGQRRSTQTRLGKTVSLRFMVTQHDRDLQLLFRIKTRFQDIGSIRPRANNASVYRVVKLEHLKSIIIPFFNEYFIAW